MIPANRLLVQLNNTGLQNKDNPLYQLLFQLINSLNSTQGLVNGISSNTNNNVTEINSNTTIIIRGNDSQGQNGRIIPGPQGIKGDAGNTGATGPAGPISIARKVIESYPRYIPIVGNQGNPGTTGSAGPMGSVLTTKYIEVVKRPIQLFQSVGSSAGSYQYLATRTGSGGATLEFKSLISASYDSYDFILHSVVLDTDNIDFLMRTSTDNGATFDSGASDYAYAGWIHNTSGSTDSTTISSGGASAITLCKDADNTANVALISGIITLFNPLGTSTYHHMKYDISYRNNNNTFYDISGSAWRLATADIDAVQFLTSSSHNISSGFIEMFGRKNS